MFRIFSLGAVSLLLLVFLAGCKSSSAIGEAVVSAEHVRLRQSTGRIPGDAGQLDRGDKVTILSEQGKFLKVRAERPTPIEGWLNKTEVLSNDLVAKAKTLEDSAKNVQPQATGKLRQEATLRLTPTRENDSNALFIVPGETTFGILEKKRIPAPHKDDKTSEKAPAPVATPAKGKKVAQSANHGERMDTWYQVRLEKNFVVRVGWLYGGSVELVIPPEIATYENSGLKFVAWTPVGTVHDSESGDVKNYVILEKPAFSNSPGVDFDRIYALSWSPDTHSYGSMFVQSGVKGRLPMQVESEKGKTVITLDLLDKDDQVEPTQFAITVDEKGRYHMARVTNQATPAHGRKGR